MDKKWEGLDDFKETLHKHGLLRDQATCDMLESWWLEAHVPLRVCVDELGARLESPGFDRFMAENGDGERDTFTTLSDAREFAEQAIANWREDANSNGEWSSCVEGVTVWVAIERAFEVSMEKERPDDLNSSDFVLKLLPDQSGEGES